MAINNIEDIMRHDQFMMGLSRSTASFPIVALPIQGRVGETTQFASIKQHIVCGKGIDSPRNDNAFV